MSEKSNAYHQPPHLITVLWWEILDSCPLVDAKQHKPCGQAHPNLIDLEAQSSLPPHHKNARYQPVAHDTQSLKAPDQNPSERQGCCLNSYNPQNVVKFSGFLQE